MTKVSIGDKVKTNGGCTIKVIDYENSRNVTVQFQDKHKHTVKTTATNIRMGQIKNPYLPSVYGVGYIGSGEYNTRRNGGTSLEYQTWQDMLGRCYNTEFQKNNPTYIGCTVCPEWHNFQNFADWYVNNKFHGLGYHLDKDLLVKGNKVYSPETCCLVPVSLNSLLNDRANDRGDYSQGVCWHKQKGCYSAQISVDGKRKHLGLFQCPIRAESRYKSAKQEYIQQKIREWHGKIDDIVVAALYLRIDNLT